MQLVNFANFNWVWFTLFCFNCWKLYLDLDGIFILAGGEVVVVEELGKGVNGWGGEVACRVAGYLDIKAHGMVLCMVEGPNKGGVFF